MPAVVLDTSVLPQHGVLLSPLISALLRIAGALGLDVVLPDLVIDESVNKRTEESAKAVTKLRTALGDAGRYFEPSPVYLPDPIDIGSEWRSELSDTFTVAPVHPDDAREALRREALRLAPASKGAGGRDAAIWLTAKRIAHDRQDVVYFVSANPNDFGRDSLRPELAVEVASAGVDLQYFGSVDELLKHVAEPFEYVSTTDYVMSISPYLIDGLISSDYLEDVGSSGEGIAPWETVLDASVIACEAVETIHAYRVDTSHLVLLRIVGRIAVQEPISTRIVNFDGRFWLELASADGPVERVSVASAALSTSDVVWDDVDEYDPSEGA